eukprot:6488686-Amphidinium_carterae.5
MIYRGHFKSYTPKGGRHLIIIDTWRPIASLLDSWSEFLTSYLPIDALRIESGEVEWERERHRADTTKVLWGEYYRTSQKSAQYRGNMHSEIPNGNWMPDMRKNACQDPLRQCQADSRMDDGRWKAGFGVRSELATAPDECLCYQGRGGKLLKGFSQLSVLHID